MIKITLELSLYGSKPEDAPYWSIGIEASGVVDRFESDELMKMLNTLNDKLPHTSPDRDRIWG